tara:strand:+ start:2875 stop:5076 length:2202 start_codon:yes stop_codon:yes gene_type:complete
MKKFTLLFSTLALLVSSLSFGQVPCGQEQVNNNLESATFILEDIQKIANDFILDLNTTSFTLNSITANLISQGGFASIDILFYENDNGFPGAQIGATIDDLVPTSQEIIGTNFNFDFHEVVLDLPAPVIFNGTGTEAVTYWVEFVTNVNASIGGIETTTLNPIGEFISFNFNTGDGWQSNTIEDGVFTMDGECTYIAGCLAVTNISYSNIMADQATISWDDPGLAAAGFIVSVFDAGANPDTATALYTENVTAGVTSTTATGLIGNSIYDVYITADCGGGELSVRNTSSFLTSALIPVCGDKFYDTGGVDEDYLLGENYTITILPDNVGDVVTANFVFVATSIIVEGFPTVDVLTVDVGDGVLQLVPEIPTGGTPKSYISVATDGSLIFTFMSNIGPGFVPSAGWDADITCGLPPNCIPPTNFMATEITDSSVELVWDDASNASNGYIVTVFLAGDIPDVDPPIGTEIVPFGTDTVAFTGLMENLDYDAYIISNCDTDGISATAIIYFSTGLPLLTCEDQFIDTGGVNGNYFNNESRVVTILPENPGEGVTITFTHVNIESTPGGNGNQDGCYDFLTIYDGPDALSPVLAQTLCGEESGAGDQPSVETSILSVGDSFSATNPDNGALTVAFSSDGSSTRSGWVADVTCALLSIDEFAPSGFNYYPNPTTGILSVGAKQPIEAITLFNITGQQVLDIQTNKLKSTLDLSSLKTGTYIMKSTINGASYTHKVIKN